MVTTFLFFNYRYYLRQQPVAVLDGGQVVVALDAHLGHAALSGESRFAFRLIVRNAFPVRPIGHFVIDFVGEIMEDNFGVRPCSTEIYCI